MNEDQIIEAIWEEIGSKESVDHYHVVRSGDDVEIDGYVHMREIAKKIVELWKEECR